MKKQIPLCLLMTFCMALFTGCASAETMKSGGKQVLRIGTYNVRVPCDTGENSWENRMPRLCGILDRNAPDVFGVQEAVKVQIDDILKHNPKLKRIGGGRNDFRDSGEQSCIFYDAGRLELLDGGTFALSETPDVPGSRSWNSACPRIATWAKFTDRQTGKQFCLYNTHLDHKSSLARISGVKLVLEHARKNCGGLPLILTGDFNARPSSKVYQTASKYLRDSRMISQTPHKGPGNTFHKYGISPNKTEPIDYIFVSEGVAVLTHAADDTMPGGKYASDHFPVFIDAIL